MIKQPCVDGVVVWWCVVIKQPCVDGVVVWWCSGVVVCCDHTALC